MLKILTFVFLMSISCYAQEKNSAKIKSEETTNEMTKDYFENILKFVLEKGNNQTYCNKYNNNPHYEMEDFHLYLNPVSQLINFLKPDSKEISDYDELVIWNRKGNFQEQYYHIRLEKSKVIMDVNFPQVYLDKIALEMKK